MGRFAPNLTSLTSPLRELLRKDVMWTWDTAQQNAMESIKKELCTTPTLALYDATKPLIISADASSYGLGATLQQEEGNGNRKVVAYASRSMTDCESRYAQIEKEALALMWACDTRRDRSQTFDPTSRTEAVGSTTLASAALTSKVEKIHVRHNIIMFWGRIYTQLMHCRDPRSRMTIPVRTLGKPSRRMWNR